MIRGDPAERNLWVVSLLDVQPTDRVLEIGFGPGVAIQALSRLAHRGVVYGVDHSEVMVRQAATRNAAAVRTGRVETLPLDPPVVCVLGVKHDLLGC